MKKMLIIKDLRDWFWSTYPDWVKSVSLDTGYLERYFTDLGYNVEITSYHAFHYQKDYEGYIVLYSSAEDYCGGSKAFMEDVLVHLKMQGAVLLPDFPFFRAHDNKVMMEILRCGFRDERLKTISSQVWSSLEELKASPPTQFPVIVKKAAGAGGLGVFLAHDRKELFRYAEKVSRMADLKQFYYLSCVNVKQRLLGKKPVLIHNTKFVTQNYIEGLQGDYKVLVFGDHYFVLHRLNRENDFRASGSGKFTDEDGSGLQRILDYAGACADEISSPWLSLDICLDGEGTCHLIEFQCLFFGFKAMSLSERHYVRAGGDWETVEGPVVPEEEFCYGVRRFLERSRQESLS